MYPCDATVVRPVESVAHLDGDQHRQRHGHWRRRLKHLTVNPVEVLVFLAALHEMGLMGEHRNRSSVSDVKRPL